MSSPFPKSKEKRPRSPSEPNKSFVKNVTSRVSGLLPATITKWFSTPSSSNTNGSAQVADATDSSTEDEAPESPTTIQPPTKKARYSPPSEEISQHVPVETKCTSTNTESIDEIYTAYSTIGRSSPRGKNIFASTSIHTHTSFNDGEKSTEEPSQNTVHKPQHSISATEQSMNKKRKSLFGTPVDDSYKKHGLPKSANVRDPYFKPSLLSSPFYVGRTMYGGASSSYLNPSFKKKTINVTNETSNDDSVNMSHSARRVMDLLEHYSSPIIEAKRIPQYTRSPEKFRTSDTSQKPVGPYGQKVYSYKTQELYVPSVASILTIKRKSRLMDSTNAARQIIASHSSSSEYAPYTKKISGGDVSDRVGSDKITTKIKSRLTRINRDQNIEMESNTSATVNLPNVVLQIDKDNLPKFTFGPISTSQAQQSSSIQTPVIITPEALKKSTEADKSDFFKPQSTDKTKPLKVENDNDYYKFSTPVPVSTESSNSTSTPPKFSFGSPERQVSINEKVEGVKANNDKLHSNTNNQINLDNKLQVQKSSDWKCLSCWVMNKTDVNTCVCCGDKKPVEFDNNCKKCSICNKPISQTQCNKCAECENKSNKFEKPLVAEVNTAKWKCSDCWVDNKESAEKCVCCGGKNPNKTKSTAVSSDKNADSEWKCNDCWIKNKSSLTKCAACGGSKPGSQTVSFNNFGNNSLAKDSQGADKVKQTMDNTFSNIAKSQSERWECPLCLVRNESDRDTCICCEASKPGTEKESQKFNFHQPSEITFKFGIQPNNQEKCVDFEPEECNMGEESETNNNVLPKTAMFSFGLPTKKSEDQSLKLDKLPETPKINFTFGVQKVDQTSPVRNNIFGIPNKQIETSKNIEENPQEVPQVFTSRQSNENLKKNIGLFNAPVTSQVAPEMPGLVPLHLMNQSPAKKDVSFLSTSVTPTTTSEAKTQQNNFTFQSIIPATNLFLSVPSTTASGSNILPGALSMSMPATTTVSLFQKPSVVTTASSFFQKSDSVPTLGTSMFSKPESTATTTSSGSMGSIQPVFSFGGQAPTVPQTEKPKFSFNFTSNKTDPGTLFKPTFGGTTDSSNTSNKFNLSSNSIIGGNTLSGNPLNNTTQMNPLTTGNSLTTSGSTIFGATVPKENMWSSSSNNLFATNTTTNGDQKPPTFTFGSSAPFNSNNTPFGTPAQGNNGPFGSTTQAQPNNAPFGSTAQQAQPNNNVPFGGTAQQVQPNNNAPFGSTPQQAPPNNTPFGSTTQQAPSLNAPFGSTQQAQPNNTPFGSAQQAQPNNAPFGSTAQPAPPNNVPFGSTTQQTQPSAPFGSITQQPQPNNVPFGSTAPQAQSTQPPPNVFGIASQTTTSQPMFGNPLQGQTTPNMFGGLQVPNNPMPMGLFGATNQVVTPSFGAINPPIPTFETSALPPPQPAPASFHFGGQPSTGIFGFGQQQQAGQPPQGENPGGMYGFGGPTATPQMQFTIGSAPNTNGRRVRKAMRRTQR